MAFFGLAIYTSINYETKKDIRQKECYAQVALSEGDIVNHKLGMKGLIRYVTHRSYRSGACRILYYVSTENGIRVTWNDFEIEEQP